MSSRQVVLARITEHVEPIERARSVWTGPTETAIHLDPKANALEQVVTALWNTVPILQNARLVLRYADGRAPIEKRLPMRESSSGTAWLAKEPPGPVW